MINFIKDAVTAVSGIKTFLFNTDYRNNFDLQDVEFPCCVLTPIMSKKYDLNNIIRESAELQLSVVDLAPYEYTGDELYAINKRCSDLALQVIANLQVKSKLDKELTFEFILPSGDELISGVMCNLTATMKQGSCIGAPSYVEIVVQPIKKESITRNGKHVISADKGFNAMREVEVDVNVDLKGSLQDKQVTITENGTTTIVAEEGYEGLNSVEVSSEVLEGFDFTKLGVNKEDVAELNSKLYDCVSKSWNNPTTSNKYIGEFIFNKDQIIPNKSEIYSYCYILEAPSKFTGSAHNSFRFSTILDIPDEFDMRKVTLFNQLFVNSYVLNLSKKDEMVFNIGEVGVDTSYANLQIWDFLGLGGQKDFNPIKKITIKGNRAYFLAGSYAVLFKCEELNFLGSENLKTLRNIGNIKKLKFGSIENLTDSNNNLYTGDQTEEVYFTKWKNFSENFASSPKFLPSPIRYIIWHALNGENALGFENEGATSRILLLHRIPYASWEEWKTTKPSVEDCEYLGVDETEITKYGELTWEDIALNVKLITIGA